MYIRSLLTKSASGLECCPQEAGLMTKLREATGFALLLVGLLGLVLPFVPGVPILMAGVAILGSEHSSVQPWIKRIEQWRSSLWSRKI